MLEADRGTGGWGGLGRKVSVSGFPGSTVSHPPLIYCNE